MRYLDLSDCRGQLHTHTSAGTAQQLSGFTAGAFLRVVSHAVIAYLGSTKIEAEGHAIAIPALTETILKLGAGQTSLWVDLGTAALLSVSECKISELG